MTEYSSSVAAELEQGAEGPSETTTQETAIATVDQAEAEHIPALTYVSVPARFLKAALVCTGADEKRPFVEGVHVTRSGDDVRITGTDGKRIFVAQYRVSPEHMPIWLHGGVIVPRQGLGRRLAIMEDGMEAEDKKTMHVQVGFAASNSYVEVRDTLQSCTFHMVPIEDSLPDFDGVIARTGDALGNRSYEAGETATYAPAMLKSAQEVASAIGAAGVSLFQPDDTNADSPSVVTFAGAPGCMMIFAPLAQAPAPIVGEANMRLLAPALKQVRAGYLANMNRSLKLLDSADATERSRLEGKIAEYRMKLAEIDSHVPSEPTIEATPDQPAAQPAAQPAEAPKAKPAKARKAKA